MPAFAKGTEAYHLFMTTIHLECPDSDPPDRSVAAEILVREEPADEEEEEEEEEEDEEEDDGKEKEDDDDDDTTDDGYSE